MRRRDSGRPRIRVKPRSCIVLLFSILSLLAPVHGVLMLYLGSDRFKVKPHHSNQHRHTLKDHHRGPRAVRHNHRMMVMKRVISAFLIILSIGAILVNQSAIAAGAERVFTQLVFVVHVTELYAEAPDEKLAM